MKSRNILLVYPEFETSFWSFKYTLQYLGKKSSMPPLGLLTIANMFPPGYNLRLVDMNVRPLTDQDLLWADIVCTSTMIVQRRSLADVVSRAHHLGKPVVAGGPHPTSYWEEKEMKDIDYMLLGEVEETFSRFLQDLEQGEAKHIYVPKERPAITKTPLPRYDLINMRDYGGMLLQFSRGCPFDCEFCDITKIYGRIPRTKTSEQMLAEFQLLYDLGYRGSLFLVDDNFIGNRRDALRFLNALIPWQKERNYPFNLDTEASMNLVEHPLLMEAMVTAGFTSVFVGIETPMPEALVATKKKQNVDKEDPEYALHAVETIQKNGLEVMAGFILGLDGDDRPDIFDLFIAFIAKAAIPIAMTGLLTALKDTDLYLRLKREGRLRGDTTGTSIGTNLNFMPQIPEEVLIAGYKRVLNTIYDRSMKNYFDRCWTLLQRLDRTQTPTFTSSPLSINETVRFIAATCRQIASAQGPAYLRFLGRVLLHKPELLREALAFGAKGYHLHKITEQVTAADDFKSYLAREIEKIKEELGRRASASNEWIQEYLQDASYRIRMQYRRIHKDFRHTVQDALKAFSNSLDIILKERNDPLAICVSLPVP